jgi:hypothetical protein
MFAKNHFHSSRMATNHRALHKRHFFTVKTTENAVSSLPSRPKLLWSPCVVESSRACEVLEVYSSL